jgi:HlyD family secretion protein
MQNRRILIPIIILLLIVIVAGGWYLIQRDNTPVDTGLQGSGTVETVEVLIAPEVAGRVVEVLAQEGSAVQAGDVLFRLDDELLVAQRQQAESALTAAQAGLDVAQSALEVAQANLDAANVQYQIEVDAAHLQDQPERIDAWDQNAPSEFKTPVWYFTKDEEISAAQAEVEAAKKELDGEQASFDKVIAKSGSADLVAAEQRLAKAQAAFLIAKDVLDRAQKQNNQTLRNEAQANYDSAKAELDAAQQDYDKLLDDEETQDVLDARARLALAKETYESALDRYNSLLTGDNSLRVQAADTALKQAEANVAQAEARIVQAQTSIDQAQAQINLIDVQMKKLVIYAPESGVVLSRNIEPGEVVQPGAVAMTIGQLDNLKITVYISEDRYGEITLGEQAQVTADSFPNQTFNATVTRIADQAEFTPRNVQTDEGRRSTVFAVELAVDNPNGQLKPGMPADVTFGK